MRELAVYGFDSDDQTLVGLGPVERARRSRANNEVPDSQRMPASESPGPFIADDDERAPALRRKKPGAWALAVPAVLVAVSAAFALTRGPQPSKLARAAAGLPLATGQVNQRISEVARRAAASPPPAESSSESTESEGATDASAAGDERLSSTDGAAGARASLAALPVSLSDLPASPIFDKSSRPDASIGTINVTSSPPANVVLDGRPLGKAPRLIRVPAGLHTVVFIHPLHGRRSLTVNVMPGVTTGASAVF